MSEQTPMKSKEFPKGITVRKTCRVCYSDDVHELFSLGTQWVNDFIDKEDVGKGVECPLTLMICKNCSLVQLRHTSPPDWMYKRYYWYQSGVNELMHAWLKDITQAIEKMIPLKEGDVVLDIGSNDGTMLRKYETPGITTVAVEPALNFKEVGAKDIDIFINDYWEYEPYLKKVGKKAKAITAIGMFYDMEDPNQFIADIAKALDSEGVFIAQLMCLQNMFKMHDIGNISHEHIEYYSFKSIEFLFNKHGMEIFDVETNEVNGQSYRFYCRLKGSTLPAAPEGAEERIKAIRDAESGYDDPKTYEEFFDMLKDNRDACVNFIKEEVAKGKKVWVYGASSKGNVILQWYNLDHTLIEGAAERSPEKYGKYTIGSMIPIYSEEDARKANPDYFLVLPYTFMKSFVNREKEWLEKGGKFIMPLPKFKLVSSMEDLEE